MYEDLLQATEAKSPAAAPVSASALSDDRYLVAYNLPMSDPQNSLRRNWKRIFSVLVMGLVLGVGLAALQFSRRDESAQTPQVEESQPQQAAAALPVSSSSQATPAPLQQKANPAVLQPALNNAPKEKLTAEEVSRLKARNRRLEALISVLRDRKQAADKRPSPDPNSIIGQ